MVVSSADMMTRDEATPLDHILKAVHCGQQKNKIEPWTPDDSAEKANTSTPLGERETNFSFP